MRRSTMPDNSDEELLPGDVPTFSSKLVDLGSRGYQERGVESSVDPGNFPQGEEERVQNSTPPNHAVLFGATLDLVPGIILPWLR